MTPNSNSPDLIFDGGSLNYLKYNMNYLKYNINSDPPTKYIPVRFSGVLGCPNEPADAYDSSGLLSKYEVEYKGKDFPFKSLREKEWATSCPDINAALNEHNNFKDLPLTGPVSASSAFLGGVTFKAQTATLLSTVEV